MHKTSGGNLVADKEPGNFDWKTDSRSPIEKRRFEILLKIESQNKFQWRHWRYYSKYKKNWFHAIAWVMKKNVKTKEKKYVTIISYRKRILDQGNFIGGAKPIPDALVEFGWLWDDSPTWCEITYIQVKDPRERTEILI